VALLTLHLWASGQTIQDSVIVSRADLIKAVEKLDYCDSLEVSAGEMSVKIAEADLLKDDCDNVIGELTELVNVKDSRITNLEGLYGLQTTALTLTQAELKKTRKQANKDKWAIGFGAGGAGALVGLLIGLFAIK